MNMDTLTPQELIQAVDDLRLGGSESSWKADVEVASMWICHLRDALKASLVWESTAQQALKERDAARRDWASALTSNETLRVQASSLKGQLQQLGAKLEAAEGRLAERNAQKATLDAEVSRLAGVEEGLRQARLLIEQKDRQEAYLTEELQKARDMAAACAAQRDQAQAALKEAHDVIDGRAKDPPERGGLGEAIAKIVHLRTAAMADAQKLGCAVAEHAERAAEFRRELGEARADRDNFKWRLNKMVDAIGAALVDAARHR